MPTTYKCVKCESGRECVLTTDIAPDQAKKTFGTRNNGILFNCPFSKFHALGEFIPAVQKIEEK